MKKIDLGIFDPYFDFIYEFHTSKFASKHVSNTEFRHSFFMGLLHFLRAYRLGREIRV